MDKVYREAERARTCETQGDRWKARSGRDAEDRWGLAEARVVLVLVLDEFRVALLAHAELDHLDLQRRVLPARGAEQVER